MNYSKLGKVLGKIMILEAVMMLAPLLISFIYKESLIHKFAFIIPVVLLFVIGGILQFLKVRRNSLYQKEGIALVALVWILFMFFGAIPFVINKEIPNYIDACFEIMSGFTTTGASIITDITVLSHSSLFWRSFSHWIGGMGILVFVLIFISEANQGYSMHLLRAESAGPQVGKLTSKMKVTTRTLYLIYLAMTVLEFVILMFDKPVPGYENDHWFFNLLITFGCAGTGGFGFVPNSLEMFSPFTQYVTATFLFLFGCNFSLYYLIILGKIKDVLKSEELKGYFGVIIIAVSSVFISITDKFSMLSDVYSTEEAFRHSYFQVASLMTTTGFTTTDYNLWPTLAKTILIIVMIIGGMAGSTAGGIKLSRIIIALKGTFSNIRKLINPRCVTNAKFERKNLVESTVNSVFAFITLYFFILFLIIFLLSFDPINGQSVKVVSDLGEYSTEHGLFSNFSAAVACMSNIGPAFDAVGPYSSYALYSPFSKILLTLAMLVGRLEILPVLALFSVKTWKRT